MQREGRKQVKSNPVEWIFFDVGETLVDESAPIADIISQLIRAAGRRGIAVCERDIREAWMQAHERFSPFPMADILLRLFPDDALRQAIWKEMKYRKELDKPFPEAKSLLQSLSGSYRIGVIANQSAGTVHRLESYGLMEHIEAVFSSAETGLVKPDPRLYEHALQTTGCPACKALMVGDRIDNDIVPARQVGMHALWIRQGLALRQSSPSPSLQPSGTIPSIGEMARWLELWQPTDPTRAF